MPARRGPVYHMNLLLMYRLLVNKKSQHFQRYGRHVVVCVYTMLLQYDLHLGRSSRHGEGVHKWYAVDVRPTWS